MDQKELLHLLTCQGEEEQQLYTRAAAQRNQAIGNGVHLRGLIEISNICRKNCLYCGIRHSNPNVNRYELTDEEILELEEPDGDSGTDAVPERNHRRGKLV